MRKIILNVDGEPRGVQRYEADGSIAAFGPLYVKTEDDIFLLERAHAATEYLRYHPGDADPFEMLEAVVWPKKEVLEAQRTRGAGLEPI